MNTRTLIGIAGILSICGTTASAQSIDWLSPVDGNWIDAVNWAGGNVPDGVTERAVLGLVGPYTVTLSNNRTFGGFTISNPDAMLQFGVATQTLHDDVVNDGLAVINFTDSSFNSVLSFAADSSIGGSGMIRMIANAQTNDAQISAGAVTITHESGHTILGSGQLNGNWINEGDILADDPTGSGLRINGTITQIGSGQIGADAGTLLLGNGSLVNGGAFNTINGGSFEVGVNLASINGVTNNGDINILGGGNTLGLNGSIQNNGSINLNTNDAAFNASVQFNANSTIDGSGVITLNSASGDQNDARIYTAAGITGTIGAGQVVSGSGRVEGSSGGMIINNGFIVANDPDFLLGIAGIHGTSSGQYRAEGNGLLGLINGAELTGVTFDSSGDGLVSVIGNLITANSVVNLGQMGISGGGHTLSLVGPMTNNGTLTINDTSNVFNAGLRFDASTSLGGFGTTVLVMGSTDNNDARIYTGGPFNGTITPGHVVMGSGMIEGASNGTIVNNGVISGTDMVFELALSGNHTGVGGGIYRGDNGVISLRNGCSIVGGTFDSIGTGEVNKTTNGIATLSGVTNIGNMGIRGEGGVIELAGDLINEGNFTINSNANVFNATVRAVSNVAIHGSGTVTMQLGSTDIGDAQLDAGDTFSLTIGADQTVEGSGRIEGEGSGEVVNLGTFNGNDPTFALHLFGNHDGSMGGVYRSDDGILGLGNGLMLNGGTFDSSGTGIVGMTTSGTATITDIHNIGTLGVAGESGRVQVFGGITNDGTIAINSNTNIFNAQFRLHAPATIDGTGTISMVMGSGDNNDAQLEIEDGFVGTIGAGQTIIGEGVLEGEMNILGTINPEGSFRVFTTDTIHFADSTDVIIDLGGDAVGSFDRFSIRGANTMTLDGSITINLEPGYAPSFGDTWDIIVGETTGTFDEVVTGIAPPGQVYRVIYEPDRVYVILTCDADLSGDGTIDFFDVSEFLSYFSAQDVRGDLNNDGVFNFFDVSVFLQLYGQGCNP